MLSIKLTAAVLACLPAVIASATFGTFDCEKREDRAPVQTIYNFPNGTWVENLAVRRSGNILVTLDTAPEVWEIHPTNHSASLVHTFPNATSTMGIIEIKPDYFAVVVGNFSLATFLGTKGSWSIWTIDLSSDDGIPKVQKAADVVDANFLNGLTTQPHAASNVLAADPNQGVIFQVDISTGTSRVLIDDPALKPNETTHVPVGVNGIRSRGDYLYFTNSFASPVLGRFILAENGTAIGPAETIVSKPNYPTLLGGWANDFALDANGNAFIATDTSNSLVKAAPSGKVIIVAGGVSSTVVEGDTSAAFGRTSRDRKTLYLTAHGDSGYPGKVLAVNVAAYL